MSVDDADRVRQITRAEWDGLREQFNRVMAVNAEICDSARRVVSEVVERRLQLEDGRLERDEDALGRHH